MGRPYGERMEKARIVMELFLDKATFQDVSNAARLLDAAGIRTFVAPKSERGRGDTHLAVEPKDLQNALAILRQNAIAVHEKESILVCLENTPGTMAGLTAKIAAARINLTYMFSVAIDERRACVLFTTSDNKTALDSVNRD